MSLKTTIFFGTIFFFSLLSLRTSAQSEAEIDRYENFLSSHSLKQADSLFDATSKKIEDAAGANDLKLQTEGLRELGVLQTKIAHDYEKAMDAFIQCLTIEDSLRLLHGQVVTYVAMSEVLHETGNFLKAKEMLERALEINRQLSDDYTLVKIQTRLGKLSTEMGNTAEALEEFDIVLKYEDVVKGTSIEAEVLYYMGKLKTTSGNYKEALEFFKRSLEGRRQLRERYQEALCLNEIGDLYRLMKNDERALANYVSAIEIFTELKNKTGMAAAYNNAGVMYYQQKNLQRAVANFELALQAAQEAQAQEQIGKSYEYLSLCYKEAGDFKKSLAYKEQYVNILDFIQRDRDERKLVEAQNRYEVDKKESQIQRLESIKAAREKELAAERQMRSYLMVVIALGVAVLLLTLYLYFVKRKSNKQLKAAHDIVTTQNGQLQELNATKDKFFSIISHDLKGPLNSLTSFSGLLINHTDSLTKEEIQMLAKDLDKSLKNLFALLENLLEWSRSQSGNIDFKSEPFDVVALLRQNQELLTAQAQNKKIAIRLGGDDAITISAHRNSITTVIRNLISNAIKFTPEGGSITLTSSVKEKSILVSISDNGVGMSKEVIDKLFRIDSKHTTKGTADEKGTGLGLILCKEFIEKNNGRIWVESQIGKGSTFFFELPLTVHAQSVIEA